MKGEHAEYCIQRRKALYARDDVWRNFTKTYCDHKKIKRLLECYRKQAKDNPRFFGDVEYRIVTRAVTDWSELDER